MRWARDALACLVLLPYGAQANLAPTSGGPSLEVSFSAVAGQLYNREGGSSLTVISAAGQRDVILGGVTSLVDRHYWSRLLPVRLRLAAGTEQVRLRARLYLCDQAQGLCRVQTYQQTVPLRSGAQVRVRVPGSAGPVLR